MPNTLHQSSRMRHMYRFGIALAGFLLLAAPRAQAQAKDFLTGMCPVTDSLARPDLSDLVDEPAQPARLLAARPHTSGEMRMEPMAGSVMVSFIIDTTGHIAPGGVAVMTSTDPRLSRWACASRDAYLFAPARSSDGKAVKSQVTMPLSYAHRHVGR